MAEKSLFIPEKIKIIEFKMIKGQVEAPEQFSIDEIDDFVTENNLTTGFNVKDKLAKVEYKVDITSDSKGKNKKEAKGSFHFVFIYSIENLDELIKIDNKVGLIVHIALGNALSSTSYSTSRGILLTRLQGTPLQNFILPVINPGKLLQSDKKRVTAKRS